MVEKTRKKSIRTELAGIQVNDDTKERGHFSSLLDVPLLKQFEYRERRKNTN